MIIVIDENGSRVYLTLVVPRDILSTIEFLRKGSNGDLSVHE